MEQEQTTQEPEKQPEENKIDVDSVVKRLEQLESSNSRLLDESKGWKEKYQSLKSSQEQIKEQELAENEQWKELVEMERNKRHELETTVSQLKKRTMQTDLKYKVASLAKDAYDVEDVIVNISKTGMLDIDPETGSIAGIEEAYNKVRNEKPFLFNTAKKSGMDPGRPEGSAPKDKTLDELIDENPNSVLADVLKDLV